VWIYVGLLLILHSLDRSFVELLLKIEIASLSIVLKMLIELPCVKII
jgi:hypothetical protein